MDEKQPLLGSNPGKMNYPPTSQPGGPGYPPTSQYPGGGQGPGYPGGQPGGYPAAGQFSGGSYQGGGQFPGGPPQGQYQQGGGYPPQGYPAGGPPQGGPPPGNPDQVQVQWKGEVPEHDVEDNPNAAPSQPSAPPLEKMDSVPGYNNIGFEGAVAPPPSYEDATRPAQPHRDEISGLPRIDEHEAREALLHHVAENCCYGKGAAQTLIFKDLEHTSAFHYTLETFGEARATSWAYVPYTGQPIDGPHNGHPPGPWDIDVKPPNLFQNQKTEIEVPHTASVKPCHNCMAMGRIRCYRCFGRGRVRCSSCNGRGHRTVYRNGEHEHERCHWCHGDGRRRCTTCHGWGMITCNCCQGTCNLKCYIKLTITWTNHLKDHIVERTALPDHLIRNVQGQIAFQEQQFRVWPIDHFPDGEINSASRNIVNEHARAFPAEKILMQRHQVRIIPVTRALYKWKGQDSDFFVYGFDKKVYAPNYPQQCCCGCNII